MSHEMACLSIHFNANTIVKKKKNEYSNNKRQKIAKLINIIVMLNPLDFL